MKPVKFTVIPLLLIVVAAFLLVSRGGARATASACAWTVVSGANPGGAGNFLHGTSAVATNDIWAVGEDTTTQGATRSLVEHWNGTQWSRIASPDVGTSPNTLNAVSAISTNDAWAVGSYFDMSGVAFTLIEHWDGTKWYRIASPSPGTFSNFLNGVVALARNNVWAVGGSDNFNSSAAQTLIEHWDGTQWSVIASPTPTAGSNGLNGVAATSAKNIWAVGSQADSSNTSHTLIEHWDGTQWSIVTSPNLSPGLSTLNSVTTLSAKNAWAVGTGSAETQTLIEHWDGTQWSIVTSPNSVRSMNVIPNTGAGGSIVLTSVAAVSASNIWTVGNNSLNTSSPPATVIEHWNGTHWSIVSNPNPGSADNDLQGVTTVPGTTQVWAVGAFINSSQPGKVLIEFHC